MSPPIPAEIIAAARNSETKWRIPASVSIAQWALESGWGAHMPGNNPFGIKKLPGYDTQVLWTAEYVQGRKVRCSQYFAAFTSIDQAFDCHARLLATSPYYTQAFNALPNKIEFITTMAATYATDPHYAAKLIDIIQSAALDRYDAATPAPAGEPA